MGISNALGNHILTAMRPLLLASALLGALADTAWVDVFAANDSLSEGIQQFRIPALVLTARGTLIAFAEARTAPQTDCGFKWIVARRSTDNGTTWSKSVDVAGRATPDFASGNPQAVFHPPSGRVVLVFGAKYIRGDPAARCSPGDAVFAVDDGGARWAT